MNPHHRLRNWSIWLPCLTIVLSLAVPHPVEAAFTVGQKFYALYDGVDPGLSVQIDSSNPDIPQQTVKAGFYNFVDPYDSTDPATLFSGFCIDITQSVSSSAREFEVKHLLNAPVTDEAQAMGAFRAQLIGELWKENYQTVVNASSAEKNKLAAAFQIAIWEIVNETFNPVNTPSNFVAGGTNVYGGTFRIGEGSFKVYSSSSSDVNAARTLAQGWLNNLNGTDPIAQLLALTNPWKQDYVVECPPTPGSDSGAATPAPPGLVLALSGALAFVGIHFYRRRRVALVPATA